MKEPTWNAGRFILALAWDYVDLDHGVIRLKDAKAGPRDVPLVPPWKAAYSSRADCRSSTCVKRVSPLWVYESSRNCRFGISCAGATIGPPCQRRREVAACERSGQVDHSGCRSSGVKAAPALQAAGPQEHAPIHAHRAWTFRQGKTGPAEARPVSLAAGYAASNERWSAAIPLPRTGDRGWG